MNIILFKKSSSGTVAANTETPTTCLRWRPTGHSTIKSILVSVNADGSICHWHAPSGKLLYRIKEEENALLCCDFNNDGSRFATAGKDFHVRVYDDDTKSMLIDF